MVLLILFLFPHTPLLQHLSLPERAPETNKKSSVLTWDLWIWGAF